ncbi:MAG TPA: hypothetical protein EYP58_05605, partial [bacterium (Candidatus Stahlbacteria)]|nr:hypothetical protein [Candidatus Stahlbacteria bacterium]
MKENLVDRIKVVVQSFNLEVFDIEVNEHQRVIRIYVDSPSGVTINQCTEIAGLLNPIIRHESYRLEVSSPGVERRLRSKEEYKKALGKMVRVKAGKTSKIGRLVRVNDDGF